MFKEFLSFASRNAVEKNEEGIKFAGDKIKIMLKAYIARNLYDNEGFYPVYLSIDNVFLKALSLIENPEQAFNY